MKLIDLNPRWVGDRREVLVFDCPVCGAGEGHSMRVPLRNPVDGGEPAKGYQHDGKEHLWTRSGEAFETLSITPSLHWVDHWHGFITDGEVTTC